MWNKILLILIVFSSSISSSVAQSNFKDGELIVLLKPEATVNQFYMELGLPLASYKNGGFGVQKLSPSMNLWLVDFDRGSETMEEILERAVSSSLVDLCQLNHTNIELRTAPNDSDFGGQYYLNNANGTPASIGAQAAWDVTTGGVTENGDSIVLAVVDGNFDAKHEDLNLLVNPLDIYGDTIDNDSNGYIDDTWGWDVFANAGFDPTYLIARNHGTRVAGIMGAKGNNGKGISGVNWDVKLMAVNGGSTVESTVVSAYSYILEQRKLYNSTNGAKGSFVVAVNSSFGVNFQKPSDYPIWCAMIDSLGVAGVLSVGAAPNTATDVDEFGDIPTTCPSSYNIAVSSTDQNDLRVIQSGFGDRNIDIHAPGESIYTTLPNSLYGNSGQSSGTSFATPMVAGAIGLLYAAACPEMFNNFSHAYIARQMKYYLLNNADSLGNLLLRSQTEGRLNIDRAIQELLTYDCTLGLENGEFPDFFGIDTNDAVLLGVTQRANSQRLKIYPNPTTGSISFLGVSNFQAQVFNVSGKLVLRQYVSNTLDLSNLPNGLYYLSLSDNDFSKTEKIILQR